ncbi:hypothetical protein a10_08581 [Streptomyces acidiscabies]|nr:hypothetical protein a10_08581 [Streptomyces acidiscabies]GAV45537.1 hypothetical protein Saa2_08528 [Streptomyces acidiscabies]
MAAEGEEVVVRGDLGDAEDVGDQRAQEFFAGCARGAAGRGGRRVGGGQGGAVEFAARGQRKGGQGDDRGRDHVVGEAGAQVVAEGLRVGGGAGHGDDVRDELVVAGDDRGLRDVLTVRQPGFDLAGFDAEAADLQLGVGAAEVGEGAVRGAAYEVARAVHASAGGAEGVGHEVGCRCCRLVEVAAREGFAGEVQLAGEAVGEGVEGGVQDMGAQAGEGEAEGGAGGLDRSGEGVDRALGGAVEVEAADAVRVPQLVPQARREGLAARDDEGRAVVGRVEEAVVEEGAQVGGGGVDQVEAVGAQMGDEGGGVGPGGAVQDVQGVAGEEAAELVPGGVEGHRGGEGDAEGGTLRDLGVQGGALVVDQVRQGAVGGEYALGAAGGARGVDDVRGVEGVDRVAESCW